MPEVELSLVVAWRSGKTVHAGPIDVSGDVVAEFRSSTETTDQFIQSRTNKIVFDPDAEYDPGEQLALTATREDLVDSELIDLLQSAHVNEVVTGADLRERRPILHAVSVGSGDNRSVFVRTTSPVKFAGKAIRGILTDSFDRVTEPILVFDDKYDFVIYPSEIVVLQPSAFERITNTPEAAAAASRRLTEGLKSQIPIHPEGLQALTRQLGRNSFLRRKAVSVSSKTHLASLTIDRVAEVLESHDLEPSEFVFEEQLMFTDENVKNLLSVLNEDVFSGDFSGIEYAAARKSTLAT